MLRAILNSRYFLWAVLALPSIPMFAALASLGVGPNGENAVELLLQPTGEFAARFMIVAMLISPLRRLFPNASLLRWMQKRRRYLGVAAFIYATFHLLLYVNSMGNFSAVLDEFFALGIWTGWLAFLVLVPLALTSNDHALRALGRSWKTIQRFAYLAAAASLAHWVFVHNAVEAALIHFAPLLVLTAHRVIRYAHTHAASAQKG